MPGVETSTGSEGVTVTIRLKEFLYDAGNGLSNEAPHLGPITGVSPRQAWHTAVDVLMAEVHKQGVPDQFTFGPFALPALPGTGAGVPLPTIDPLQALQDIVQAINAAEGTLNKQNFVISSGSVEAKLNLPIAGVTVTFAINPKPYS